MICPSTPAWHITKIHKELHKRGYESTDRRITTGVLWKGKAGPQDYILVPDGLYNQYPDKLARRLISQLGLLQELLAQPTPLMPGQDDEEDWIWSKVFGHFWAVEGKGLIGVFDGRTNKIVRQCKTRAGAISSAKASAKKAGDA